MRYFLLFLLLPLMAFCKQDHQIPIKPEPYLCPVYWHDQYIYIEIQGHVYKVVQLEHDLNVCQCLHDLMYKPTD